jgi:23S rRNA G2069 N7-methylase RlmK/C1962 C5-methylase RlmI
MRPEITGSARMPLVALTILRRSPRYPVSSCSVGMPSQAFQHATMRRALAVASASRGWLQVGRATPFRRSGLPSSVFTSP